MKYIVLLFAIVSLSLTSSLAATRATNNVAAGAHTLVTNAVVVLDSITLWSTNTVPTLVYLYNGSTLYTNAAYTNYTTYVTNIVQPYITSTGTTNQMTNTTLWVQANPVAAVTGGAAQPLATLVVPANNIATTFEPPIGITFNKALVLSNALTGVSGVVSYRTQ